MVMKKGYCSSMNAKMVSNNNDNNNNNNKGDEIIVLAHGYGSDQSFWDKVVPNLSQKYRVLLFDWCFCHNNNHIIIDGHGFDSSKYTSLDVFADDLIGLIDEMGIKCCSFVGHSMSGLIGCIASIKRPHLFNNLILVGASPRYLNTEDYEGGFDNPQIEQLLSTMESNFEGWATSFAPLAMGVKDPILIDKFEKSLKKMNPMNGLAVAKLIFLGDYRHVLEQVNTPCTLICTKNDIVVPCSVPSYMQKKMIKIKSKVEIIDVDGHFPHLTAPQQFLPLLTRVLLLDTNKQTNSIESHVLSDN